MYNTPNAAPAERKKIFQEDGYLLCVSRILEYTTAGVIEQEVGLLFNSEPPVNITFIVVPLRKTLLRGTTKKV